MRRIKVVRRVLPLRHRRHRNHAGDGRSVHLLVGAPLIGTPHRRYALNKRTEGNRCRISLTRPFHAQILR